MRDADVGSVCAVEASHGLEEFPVAAEAKTGAEFIKSAGISRGRMTATQVGGEEAVLLVWPGAFCSSTGMHLCMLEQRANPDSGGAGKGVRLYGRGR